MLTDDDAISAAETEPVMTPAHTYSAALRKKFRASMATIVHTEQVFGETQSGRRADCLPKGTRFHDLRHFYASTLIAASLNPR